MVRRTLVSALILGSALVGCSADCTPYDVLRVDLSPIEAVAPEAARLWEQGSGGLKWPSGQDPPAEAAALSAVLLRGEPAAETLRVSAVLGTERLLLLELPVRTATGARLAVSGVIAEVQFTGGYGSQYGWWDDSWKSSAQAGPLRASVLDPFAQTLSAVTSTGTVEVRARAPLELWIDLTCAQRSGPAERVRAKALFALEEGRAVCSGP